MRAANAGSLPSRFSAIVTAASFAEWVTSARIASSTRIVSPLWSPSLVGVWAAACSDTVRGSPARTAGAPDPGTRGTASSSWSARPGSGAPRRLARTGPGSSSGPRRWPPWRPAARACGREQRRQEGDERREAEPARNEPADGGTGSAGHERTSSAGRGIGRDSRVRRCDRKPPARPIWPRSEAAIDGSQPSRRIQGTTVVIPGRAEGPSPEPMNTGGRGSSPSGSAPFSNRFRSWVPGFLAALGPGMTTWSHPIGRRSRARLVISVRNPNSSSTAAAAASASRSAIRRPRRRGARRPRRSSPRAHR